MSPEIVALLVLAAAVVAAVAFTIIVVVRVDPSNTNTRRDIEQEREGKKGQRV